MSYAYIILWIEVLEDTLLRMEYEFITNFN